LRSFLSGDLLCPRYANGAAPWKGWRGPFRENKSDGYEKCKKPNNDGPPDGLTDRNAPEGLREKKTTISARPVAVQDDLALPDFLDRRKSKLGQAPIGPGGDDDDLDYFTEGL